MKTKPYRQTIKSDSAKSRVALLFVALLAFGDLAVFARQPKPTPAAGQEAQDAPKIPNDQLDSLVAPIALYPDPLLSQVLVASTYPLEIVQLQQWLATKGNHGQGPAAPLGKMDFMVKGAMIGGFALVAAPAHYRVTGVKTFVVSYEGTVYEKDLGQDTLNIFKKMELYNPDKTWRATNDAQ